tara:strand:+ start:231 stop:1145 length:915 start_codon:yes stop_codon:yes gene_type:complete
MSKGSGGGSQTMKSIPWEGQQPYLSNLYSEAQRLYNQGGPQVYPGRTFALPTEKQLTAENLQVLNALGPQALMSQNLANAQNFSLAGPQNLATNPYLAGATEAALRPLYSQTQGLLQQARRSATGAGQLDSDRQALLEQGVIGDYLTKAGDVTSRMYSDAYNNALTQQARAMSLAPQTLAAMNVPAETLGQVGLAEQARQQQAIDEARARFEAQQARPYETLAGYGGIVGGNTGYGERSGTMQGQDPTFGQRALGGAAAGLGTYGAIGSDALAPILGSSGLNIARYAGPIGLAVGVGSALGLFD